MIYHKYDVCIPRNKSLIPQTELARIMWRTACIKNQLIVIGKQRIGTSIDGEDVYKVMNFTIMDKIYPPVSMIEWIFTNIER